MVEIGNSVVHKLCSLLSSIHLLKKKKKKGNLSVLVTNCAEDAWVYF